MIQLNRPYICKTAIENVVRILESGWIGLGPETEKFEKEFAEYIGCKHAIALNSGTEALRLAVESLKTNNGKDIITTPNTFVSTNHVILQTGFCPRFADIDPATGSIDPDSVLNIIDYFNPAAIMAVHYSGLPVDLQAFRDIANKYGIPLIEDCAHATGALYRGEKIGRNSFLSCFSFHAVKNLGIGDGGMLCTNNDQIAEEAKKMRWLGINRSTSDRSKENKYNWDYDVELLGYKSHMNDIMAAIGRGQLTRLDIENVQRMKIANLYRRLLSDSKIKYLNTYSDRISSNHLFVVRFPSKEEKEAAIERLRRNDIQYGYHYKPNYLYSVYKHCHKYPAIRWPGMEEFYATALSLPMHILLSAIAIKKVCEVIRNESIDCDASLE